MKEQTKKIFRKTREMYTLKNRFRRYERRLLVEGMKIARQSNLEVEVNEVEDGFVDSSPLIELAKQDFPSLYRRYLLSQERYFEGLARLRGLLKN